MRTVRRALVLTALVMAAAACRRSAVVADAGSTSAPVGATGTAASSVASAAVVDAGPDARVWPTCEFRDPADALAKAKAAMAQKHYDVAVGCYAHANVYDSRTRGEMAYAKILAGDPEGALADLDQAEDSLEVDDALLAQLEFNRGLACDALGRTEDARGAYAWSNRLAPTPAAKAKLAGRSACIASVTRSTISSTAATFATYRTRSWVDVFQTVWPTWTVPSDPRTAKHQVCSGSTDPDAGETSCTGPLWQITAGDMGGRIHQIWIQPLPDGQYLVVDGGYVGGGCTGFGAKPILSSSAELVGDLVVHEESMTVVTGDPPRCTEGRKTTSSWVYDGAHGIVFAVAHAGVKVKGRTMTFDAPGCDPVSLDAVDASAPSPAR